MAQVPTAYVKDKAVNYEGEIFAMLGEGVRVGGYHFRPPSLGVWALWEILDSPIIHADDDATMGDYLRLLWVNDVRRDAVPIIAEWVAVGKPAVGLFCELDDIVEAWAKDSLVDEVLGEDVRNEIISQMPLCYTGYETMPASGGSAGLWLFAGEAFGAICSVAPSDSDTLIWDIPMTLNGHMTAHRAAVNGVKGVGRQKDEEDIKEQLKLANEREAKGKLHPWQIKDPIAFPLTSKQCEFPATIMKYESLLKAQNDGS